MHCALALKKSSRRSFRPDSGNILIHISCRRRRRLADNFHDNNVFFFFYPDAASGICSSRPTGRVIAIAKALAMANIVTATSRPFLAMTRTAIIIIMAINWETQENRLKLGCRYNCGYTVYLHIDLVERNLKANFQLCNRTK